MLDPFTLRIVAKHTLKTALPRLPVLRGRYFIHACDPVHDCDAVEITVVERVHSFSDGTVSQQPFVPLLVSLDGGTILQWPQSDHAGAVVRSVKM